MFLKDNSPDELCRVTLATVNEPLDCVALDCVYHRVCLVNHERNARQLKIRQKMRASTFWMLKYLTNFVLL